MNQTRRFDLVLFGASGFVGRLVAQHLADQAPAGVRIALAGRTLARLEEVRDRHGRSEWALLTADSSDHAALADLAGAARVVASTVGPYHRHGLPLVLECARAGTDYVDLTGEVAFVRESIDRAHDEAVRTGARIVHSCGFDSVPSDLAVHLLHGAATADGAGGLGDTTLLVTQLRGGLSGGTVDSMREQLTLVRSDREAAQLAADPYALAPDRATEPRLPGQDDSTEIFIESASGRWTAPFVMASYNTRIVRRSHALLREHGDTPAGYGAAFRYREMVDTGRGRRGRRRAQALRTGLAALWLGLSTPGLSRIVDALLPEPGEGPSAAQRDAGRFEVQARTTTDSGEYLVTVGAQGDPGYAATSVMIGQAALALAVDPGHCHPDGGVLTPAVALGDVLVERLRAQGFRLRVDPL
ncbi:saccharopine dehydrogenase NADP-binding domain-containing protein [Brachybacterium muris]|uniref:saccharopine dehydrogenase family protein n=1 Tax=Brachybacterium muris TaxID=219301 RepID=UPI00223BD19B|nr:saccharopine dehydrogenase NADP-binding domain-containing protein [Brachybacterium muris]MCT2178803.1 saccharopine dehydrogenase NADP-binding domain-containing protein [Brachybacterium muris]MCT2262806.1 saccharopine dehydrogenase NADP-binding domain-containing protein [Brachybacterium muris]